LCIYGVGVGVGMRSVWAGTEPDLSWNISPTQIRVKKSARTTILLRDICEYSSIEVGILLQSDMPSVSIRAIVCSFTIYPSRSQQGTKICNSQKVI
jgi:hypothetical protein